MIRASVAGADGLRYSDGWSTSAMTMPSLPPAEISPPLSLPRRADGRVFNMVTPLLDRHVLEGRGDRPALRLDEGVITYDGLRVLVNRAGNALRDAGIEPEQRVALLLPDGVEFVATFLGAMKIGAVPVPLNTLAPPDQLAYFLEDSRARALVTTPILVGPVLEGDPEGRHPLLRTVFVAGDIRSEGAGRLDARSYAAARAAASPDLEAFPTGADEPCYWLYSSGTTGPPKGTVHLHGDMLACVTPYAEEVVGIGPDDVTFSVARLFFSYGLVNSLFLPLLAGASAALTPDRPEPGRVLGVLRRHRPSLFFSVPTSYAALATALEGGEHADRPFGSVRLSVSAGEPLPAPLYHRWVNLTGVELLDGIGSTEVGYIFCSNLPGQVRPGSSGVAIGDHRLRIVDEQGRDVGQGVAGELLVQAESTALHYWNRRARSRETFVGEWLRTGDRYRRD
ncbi:MAG: benzoate-CoA ligase family protein, partial [Chloroflexi bacterium]|nr:benzoate-CoA ligase family protein [Chloroflexota bacterium]